ncbi:hypothetical protein EP56_05795 [Listeriaceae bacterium FSL A5-0209]|nr:hypothetical protein EP56_05795 [Listeriaceae bacterium FSL A5-0209]
MKKHTPILYDASEKDFLHTGIGFLSEAKSCTVREVLNAEFELEMEYPIKGKLADQIVNGRYIFAWANDQDKEQAFIIDDVEKDMFKSVFVIKATHRTYKLSGNMVKRFEVKDVTCHLAMQALKTAMLEPSDIEFYSDIASKNSTLVEFKNAMTCIAGTEGSILDRWRGEMKRETRKLSMLKKRGVDSGVRIAFRKNMTGLQMKVNTGGMINAILPFARKQLAGSEVETTITLPDNYIFAPTYKPGSEIIASEVDYSQDETVISVATLRTAASTFFNSSTAHEVDLSLEVSFQDLGQTEEYKAFQNMNRVFMGDTLSVYHEELNVNVTSRMVEYTTDSLAGRYISCVVGSVSADFKTELLADVATREEIDNSANRMQQYVDELTNQITGNNGGNLVIRPMQKPSELLIMDTESIDTAVDVWRFNKGGLGHSSNGYNGPYTVGITQKGQIVADLVSVGTLRAINVVGVTIASSAAYLDTLYSSFLPPLPLPQYREILKIGGGSGFSLNAKRDNYPFPAMDIRLNTNGDLGFAIEAINETTGEVNADKVIRLSPHAGAEAPIFYSRGWCYVGTNATGRIAFIDYTTWQSGGGPQIRYVPARASAWETASSNEYKENIKKMTKKNLGQTAKEIVLATNVYMYTHKADEQNEKRIGFIAEQAPDALTTSDGKAIELYNAVAILFKKAQEDHAEMQTLKAEIAELKRGEINDGD